MRHCDPQVHTKHALVSERQAGKRRRKAGKNVAGSRERRKVRETEHAEDVAWKAEVNECNTSGLETVKEIGTSTEPRRLEQRTRQGRRKPGYPSQCDGQRDPRGESGKNTSPPTSPTGNGAHTVWPVGESVIIIGDATSRRGRE